MVSQSLSEKKGGYDIEMNALLWYGLWHMEGSKAISYGDSAEQGKLPGFTSSQGHVFTSHSPTHPGT